MMSLAFRLLADEWWAQDSNPDPTQVLLIFAPTVFSVLFESAALWKPVGRCFGLWEPLFAEPWKNTGLLQDGSGRA